MVAAFIATIGFGFLIFGVEIKPQKILSQRRLHLFNAYW